jgi:hypothetical protein
MDFFEKVSFFFVDLKGPNPLFLDATIPCHRDPIITISNVPLSMHDWNMMEVTFWTSILSH